MRMRNADWHDKYTLPSLMEFYSPSRSNHGSYFYDWTLEDEVAWRNFYQVWFRLLNDYKKMGGRVTASADAAFIYNTYGFGNIHEMELLREAGFHPLEVIQAATYNPAKALADASGKPMDRGVVRAGLLADLIVLDQNPLRTLTVLYGTGAVKLNDQTRRVERVGGIKYTIKDGIVYDAKKLLADVGAMVDKQKQQKRTTSNY
jgi:imidazolonepropionase-like amidohydrolase